MAHDPLKCVAAAPIFVGLPHAVLRALTTVSVHQVQLPAGQFLYEAGSPADRLLVIDTGRVKVFHLNEKGQEQVLYMLNGRAVDSEAALFTTAAHQNFAQAVTDCQVCSIRKHDFQQLLRKDPEIAVKLLSAFGSRLTDLETRSARFGTLTAKERLLNFLEETAKQQANCHFTLPLTKRDLASWLNITPETLSRQFAKLQREHRIDIHGSHVHLL